MRVLVIDRDKGVAALLARHTLPNDLQNNEKQEQEEGKERKGKKGKEREMDVRKQYTMRRHRNAIRQEGCFLGSVLISSSALWIHLEKRQVSNMYRYR